MQTIKFKKLSEDVILPSYAHPEDAGMDIFSAEEKTIESGKWALVKAGFSMELPTGFEAQVRSKSGLSLKSGIIVLNSPGTIDENYRGEVGVILMNVSQNDYKVEKNQKIAQMVITRVPITELEEVEVLDETERGEKGFGSSGR